MVNENRYPNIVEDIIKYQADLMVAFWQFDYDAIDRNSKKIQILINRILKDNLLLVENRK